MAKGSGSFSCNLSSNGFTLTEWDILDLAGRQMTEYDGSGNWEHTNVFALGQLLATYSSTGTPMTFALNDWLGTKRVQATANGEFSMSYASLPYGDNEVTSGSGPNATAQFFTGKQRDSESGNDYFGARYYAENDARFMSPDWSAKVEPVPYAKMYNPQSLDLYSYTVNNPLAFIDPHGHVPCSGVAQVTIVVTPNGSSMTQSPDNCQTSLSLFEWLQQNWINPITPRKGNKSKIPNVAPNNPTNPQQPQKPPCNPATVIGGLAKAEDGYQNAAMAFTFGGLQVGLGAVTAVGGCSDPTPFEPVTCAGGIFAGGVFGASGGLLLKLGVYEVTHEMIPGVKQAFTCKHEG